MNFPSDYPEQAVNLIAGKITGTPVLDSSLALAVYEVIGYGLNQVYPNATLMAVSGESLPQLKALKPEDFKPVLDNLPLYIEIVKAALVMKAEGKANWLIALKLTLKYGVAATKPLVTLWRKLQEG